MENKAEIISKDSNHSIDVQLHQFENSLLEFISMNGLPTTNVLVDIDQRKIVIGNVNPVLTRLSDERIGQSIYISKFLAAVSSGLFDAALNYLWDETIFELRKRISQYDITYFFDIVCGNNNDKRRQLSSPSDLEKISDSDLIRGANEIGLISDFGYRHIDNIRYMRNWASAAHPNQNQITGLQLIGMLETCIIEVINLPLSNVVVETKQLLSNIKTNSISQEEANQISIFFTSLTQEKVNALALGFFGIYTNLDTLSQTRQNINFLMPALWPMVDESTKSDFGIRYAQYVATNDTQHSQLSREFLEIVSGLSYIPNNMRIAEIKTAIDNLLIAHRGANNFYNEPAFASQLERLIGTDSKIPIETQHKYVLCVVEVYLTNGNGVAWNAEPHYENMLNNFDSTQASIAVFSFATTRIDSRLQFPLCQTKFKNLINLMKNKVTSPMLLELIEKIENFSGPLYKMKDDPNIKSRTDALIKIFSQNK